MRLREIVTVGLAAVLAVALAIAAGLTMKPAEAQTTSNHVLYWQQKCPLDAGGIVTIEFDRTKRANIVSCSILE